MDFYSDYTDDDWICMLKCQCVKSHGTLKKYEIYSLFEWTFGYFISACTQRLVVVNFFVFFFSGGRAMWSSFIAGRPRSWPASVRWPFDVARTDWRLDVAAHFSPQTFRQRLDRRGHAPGEGRQLRPQLPVRCPRQGCAVVLSRNTDELRPSFVLFARCSLFAHLWRHTRGFRRREWHLPVCPDFFGL